MGRFLWALRWMAVAAVVAVLAAACTSGVPMREQGAPPVSNDWSSDFPQAYYRHALAQGQTVLQIDPRRSLVVLEVRRAGPFAKFGHDHVVASHDVQGYVAPDANRADLSIRLDRLVVDEAALRRQAGFDEQPSPDDIAGTRHNMLSKVLQADRYPYALIHVTRQHANPLLNVTITLHGVTHSYQVPADITQIPEGLMVSGSMHFRQTDFGIVPFSILNGAIRVSDGLTMHFRIAAVR